MRLRVLIADDQPAVRAALGALIAADARFELVGEAVDAEDAIALATRYSPHVALLDYKMPKGGGVRAAQEIRRVSPVTQVVALSAYEDRTVVFEMVRAGAVGYLVKGASAAEIKETIVRTARGEGRLSTEVTADVVRELGEQLEQKAHAAELERQKRLQVRRALEPGAVRLVFQPIVELATGAPVGYEALSRFRLDPQKPPDWWFAQAAETGLLTELEVVSLGLAREALETLPAGLFLSVNVVPTSLLSPAVRTQLHAMQPERVVVELTEHAPVDDYGELGNVLTELRSEGLRVAVDDAGAGYASLRHVLKLAPDQLKIDGEVVRGIELEKAPRALTAALLAFARELGVDVVAEGIERPETLAVLAGMGVKYGQGYALGRPSELPQAA